MADAVKKCEFVCVEFDADVFEFPILRNHTESVRQEYARGEYVRDVYEVAQRILEKAFEQGKSLRQSS